MSNKEGLKLPASNADAIAFRMVRDALVHEVMHPGDGLEALLEVARARCLEIRQARTDANPILAEAVALSSTSDEEWKEANLASAGEDAKAALVRIRCTQWFLSRLFRSLADELEWRVYEQEHYAKVSAIPFHCHAILYNDDGSMDHCAAKDPA